VFNIHRIFLSLDVIWKFNTKGYFQDHLATKSFIVWSANKYCTDIRNLKIKINTLENIDIKKLKSKLAAIRQDLIAHDGKLDSQWKQHLTTQEKLEQELKTKSEQVDNMEQVLLNLEAHGELTEHGWETIPPQIT